MGMATENVRAERTLRKLVRSSWPDSLAQIRTNLRKFGSTVVCGLLLFADDAVASHFSSLCPTVALFPCLDRLQVATSGRVKKR